MTLAPFEERFWSRVEKTETCWLWHGGASRDGYGRVRFQGRLANAHRVTYELAYGPIPDGLWVLHRCDNPPCVRPDHLFLGTNRDNMLDGYAKGRVKPPPPAILPGPRPERWKTHCKHGHEFTPENTRLRKTVGRDCLTCELERRHRRFGFRGKVTRPPKPRLDGGSKDRNLDAEGVVGSETGR